MSDRGMTLNPRVTIKPSSAPPTAPAVPNPPGGQLSPPSGTVEVELLREYWLTGPGSEPLIAPGWLARARRWMRERGLSW